MTQSLLDALKSGTGVIMVSTTSRIRGLNLDAVLIDDLTHMEPVVDDYTKLEIDRLALHVSNKRELIIAGRYGMGMARMIERMLAESVQELEPCTGDYAFDDVTHFPAPKERPKNYVNRRQNFKSSMRSVNRNR